MEMELPSSSPSPPSAMAPDQASRDPEDVILLTVIRCIGLLYGYYQIQLLCTLGSKYTLLITSIFPILGSLIFNSLSFYLPEEFLKIPETSLYFLLIMDLPRACFLTSIALKNSECCKVGACSSSIFQGVKILAPWLSMDTVIECVVLLLGYCSGIRRLEALCAFVCLSVVINYTVLLTAFPITLRIIHEIINGCKELHATNRGNYTGGKYNHLSSAVKKSNDANRLKPNSGGSTCSKLDQLILNWGEPSNDNRGRSSINVLYANEANLPTEICQLIHTSSFWLRGKILAAVILVLAYVFGWISISVDQLVVLSVAAALTIRYLFFEEKLENFRTVSEESTVTTTTTTVNTVYLDSSGHQVQAGQPQQSICSSTNTTTLGNRATAAAPIASSTSTTSTTSTAVPTPSQRRRKMAVNANEVEMLLNKNNLCAAVVGGGSKNNGKDFREACSSPDSGISKSSSGSVTPITFSIGDHSESDGEGEAEDAGMKMENAGTQTMLETKLETLKMSREEEAAAKGRWAGPPRSLEECIRLYQTDEGVKGLSDEEIINLVNGKYIPAYQLEKAVQDLERGVAIRRKISCMQKDVKGPNSDIPYKNYDYTLVQGACCENVIGYIPVPVGIAGPLDMDGNMYYIPMATTEGCLVASTNRGCRALTTGVRSRVVNEGMSRAPVVRFPTATRAAEAMIWLNEPENFQEIKESFDASSRFARLVKIHPRIAGRYLFIRFVAKTGDAMGMNMISKGTEVALQALLNHFHDMEILALSGNVCTDKKPAAINWLEGRGKSVVAEAIVPANIVESVLKTTTSALVELNIAKNLIGSATAGSIGGFNAHAANIVTAVYIACGQDPAQNVGSSNCITIMEPSGDDGRDLFISCTMPSIECGTIGGGTILPAQAACLEMLGVKGAHSGNPGENARTFARIVSAAVLAGELSLMSALAAGHLVRSHLKHNRSATLLTALEQQQIQVKKAAAEPSIIPASVPISSSDKAGATLTKTNLKTPVNPLPTAPTAATLSPDTPKTNGDLVKHCLNSKSSPVITTMDFLSVPDCKQT